MDNHGVPYQRLSIYQTKARLYIVGYCKLRATAALLKVSKQEPTQLDVAEVVGHYSLEEIRAMLSQIHMANAHLGGLQLVTHCCGIIGCFRFTETYYLLLVTRKAHVGSLCGGHKVYTVAATALVPLHPGYHAAGGQPSGAAEKRYVKLLMGMDLTKHFYFSYTYNLAHTVQRNCKLAQQQQVATGEPPGSPAPGPAGFGPPPCGPFPASATASSSSVYDSMFTWNAYLTSALRRALGGNTRWTVPLIHGFWEQRRLSIYGRPLTLTLIARRSRHFAGTRFRKRGINDGGKVANEVETEQVVDAGTDYRTRTPLLSSVVQVRGSVPLFWSQQLTALSPKPEIILQQFDPLYEVTEAHFSDLECRYGAPAVVLNLLKSKERRPREVLLRRELAAAIAQLNAQRGRGRQHIVYIPWDFSKHAKQSGSNLLGELAAITRLALDMTGLFVHNPAAPTAKRPTGQGGALAGASGPLSPQSSSLLARTGSGFSTSGITGAQTTTVGASHAAHGLPSLARSSRGQQGALPRAVGEGGSTLHLAAAAEAAAAAVRARKAAARAHAGGVNAAAFFPTRSSLEAGGGGSLAAAGGAGGGSHPGSSRHPSGSGHTQPSRLAGHATHPHHPPHLHAPHHHSGHLHHFHGYQTGNHSPSISSRTLARSSSSAAAAAAAAAAGGGAVQWQSGVLRTNCIDCLDRTNVAQFAFGLVAFGRQLYKLGLHDLRDIDADSSAAFTLMALYEAMGHVLSLQYGGSEAHTIFFQRKKGEWEAATQSKDLVTSIKRLYSNTYTDAEKQDAINLFLGNFVPQPNQPHLWQLDTDYYLHSETTIRPSPAVYLATAGPLSSASPSAALLRRSSSRTMSGGGGGGSGGGAPPPLPVSHSASDQALVAAAATAAAVTPMTQQAGGVWAAAAEAMAREDASAAAAAAAVGTPAAAVAASSGTRFLGPPSESPLPLDVSSDDDDDTRSQSYQAYHAPGMGPDGGGGAAGASPYSSHSSAAIPFHRAPSTGGFLASLLPGLRRGGGAGGAAGSGGGGASGSGGGGLLERVVTSLLQPGGAGAAARAAAAGVGGGALPGGASGGAAQLLLSFDQALARAPNQVWPIRLHGDDDKQGRWAAVQAAFSFFWTSNAAGGAGEGGGARNNYQLDDAPRPPKPPPSTPLDRAASGRLISPASPTAVRSPLASPPSGLTSLPYSPETSRHGGPSAAAAASTIRRTLTAGTEGGFSTFSDPGMSPTYAAAAAAAAAAPPPGGLAAAAAAAAGAGASYGNNRTALHLGHVFEAMIDADHTDEHHDHGSACRTVADTIPALRGSGGGGGGGGGSSGGAGSGGDDEGAFYYSAADAEAAAAGGQADGGGGGGVVRQSGVRSVAQMLGSALLSQGGQAGGGVGGGSSTKQPFAASSGPNSGPTSIPVLNDFIEVAGPGGYGAGGGGGPGGGGGGLRSLAAEHRLDPAARRRAAAEAASRAREEERQRKLLTAGLEVSDLLGLGPEDLGLHWELQPWWGLEPRPSYRPRAYEPHPSRLRGARQAAAEAEAAAAAAAKVKATQEQEGKAAAAAAARGEQRGRKEEEEGGDLLAFSSSEEEGEKEEEGTERTTHGSEAALRTSPHQSPQQQQRLVAVSYMTPSCQQGETGSHHQGGGEAEEPDVPPPAALRALLQQKQQQEHIAFLHYDVAQLHARAKLGDFLSAIPLPYGLYGEERRRDMELYDSYCYIERL